MFTSIQNTGMINDSPATCGGDGQSSTGRYPDRSGHGNKGGIAHAVMTAAAVAFGAALPEEEDSSRTGFVVPMIDGVDVEHAFYVQLVPASAKSWNPNFKGDFAKGSAKGSAKTFTTNVKKSIKTISTKKDFVYAFKRLFIGANKFVVVAVLDSRQADQSFVNAIKRGSTVKVGDCNATIYIHKKAISENFAKKPEVKSDGPSFGKNDSFVPFVPGSNFKHAGWKPATFLNHPGNKLAGCFKKDKDGKFVKDKDGNSVPFIPEMLTKKQFLQDRDGNRRNLLVGMIPVPALDKSGKPIMTSKGKPVLTHEPLKNGYSTMEEVNAAQKDRCIAEYNRIKANLKSWIEKKSSTLSGPAEGFDGVAKGSKASRPDPKSTATVTAKAGGKGQFAAFESDSDSDSDGEDQFPAIGNAKPKEAVWPKKAAATKVDDTAAAPAAPAKKVSFSVPLQMPPAAPAAPAATAAPEKVDVPEPDDDLTGFGAIPIIQDESAIPDDWESLSDDDEQAAPNKSDTSDEQAAPNKSDTSPKPKAKQSPRGARKRRGRGARASKYLAQTKGTCPHYEKHTTHTHTHTQKNKTKNLFKFFVLFKIIYFKN